MKKDFNIWPIVAIIAILAACGLGIYGIYAKKSSKAGYVSDDIMKVFTSGYDWFAENYGSDVLASQVTSQEAGASDSKTDPVNSFFGV